jgi:hypothetical protein
VHAAWRPVPGTRVALGVTLGAVPAAAPPGAGRTGRGTEVRGAADGARPHTLVVTT